MIRIYLDWNVVSSLKKPEFQEIKDFITEHKQYLLLPYSPAHFSDLMKSYKPDNKYFERDLETLEFLSGKHLIRWGINGIEPLFGTPSEYFKEEKEREDFLESFDIEKIYQELDDSNEELGMGKMGSLLKSLLQFQPSGIEIKDENKELMESMLPNLKPDSSMWDLMKASGTFTKNLLLDGDYYKSLRNSIAEQGFKLEANSGNWDYDEVIKNIDEFLIRLGTNMTYRQYVESAFQHKKEPINQFEYYTAAYLMLDMIGYKSDKLPKNTDTMRNVQVDGEHSFYGAHCDYFVAIDKKLRIKSKVLYNEHNISTKIIEPSELVAELEKVIKTKENVDFIGDTFSFCQKENLVESYPPDEEGIETFAFQLPYFYFNFFNYVVLTRYPKKDAYVFTFKKVFKNYSKFIYYTETERLLDSIVAFLGTVDKGNFEFKKHEFINGNKEVYFDWNFEGGLVRLEIDGENKRPTLIYVISTKNQSKETK